MLLQAITVAMMFAKAALLIGFSTLFATVFGSKVLPDSFLVNFVIFFVPCFRRMSQKLH